MNDYKEVNLNLHPCSEDMTDLLAANLAEIGYESFVPSDSGLTAYIPLAQFDRHALDTVIDDFPMLCQIEAECSTVEGRDWNEEWERNYFKPIIVGGSCVIHSSFHTDVPQADYDIVIDPKMAFGTGHHATTSLMIEQILKIDLQGCKVIDMGTGSGILAILCAMRGAETIIAVEIDEAAYVNAIENCGLNNVAQLINIRHGDVSTIREIRDADILLANINRNIITHDLPEYAASVRKDGMLAFSGFYEQDIPVVRSAAERCDLHFIESFTKDNWAATLFMKL